MKKNNAKEIVLKVAHKIEVGVAMVTVVPAACAVIFVAKRNRKFMEHIKETDPKQYEALMAMPL